MCGEKCMNGRLSDQSHHTIDYKLQQPENSFFFHEMEKIWRETGKWYCIKKEIKGQFLMFYDRYHILSFYKLKRKSMMKPVTLIHN